MPDRPSTGPMQGVRVIDASTILAGPTVAQILGDFGADVIKVEHPLAGDPLRTHGPKKEGTPLWWKTVNRNKRTISLLLSHPDGADVLAELASTADVLIENFRPGTLDRWGLTYDRLRKLNPRLIVLRVTGFGQTGPYSSRAGFGTLAESMSGFAHITGPSDGPPTLPPFGLADGVAGLAGAIAVSMALYHRDAHGGAGQEIDLNILEPLISMLGGQSTIYDQLGIVQGRTGNRSGNNSPRNLYATRDGKWIAVSTSANSIAARVMTLVGHPEVIDEPWFAEGSTRAQHADLLDGHVAAWVGERTQEQAIAELIAAEAAVAPIYDIAQLMADPHVRATDVFIDIDDPDLGVIKMNNLLFRMRDTPGGVRHTGRGHGDDTDAVLIDELGLDPDRVARMRSAGVVA